MLGVSETKNKVGESEKDGPRAGKNKTCNEDPLKRIVIQKVFYFLSSCCLLIKYVTAERGAQRRSIRA